MTYSLDIFTRRSALAGRDGQRDIAKNTGYFDKTFTSAKASKFNEKEGGEKQGNVGYVTFLKAATAMAFSRLFLKNSSLIEHFKKP